MNAPSPSPPDPASFTPSERRVTLAGLMIVFLLSAMDATIVATAMPRIVGQLHGLGLYAWVTTAYFLASTVTLPIYGKLSDLYGRKSILVFGVSLFTAGSVLSGFAGAFGGPGFLGGGMVQLILARGLQGLGGGALFISSFAIIADMFSPRERGRFSALFGAVFGLAALVGPLVGGFFTQMPTVEIGGLAVQGWRWAFLVNLPVSLVALFMILARMPALPHRVPGPIDWFGAVFLVVTFVPLLLALSLGGRDYAWSSPQVLGLLAVAAAGLALFLLAEMRAANPILPLRLFRNRTFWAGSLGYFTVSCAYMGTMTFLPLYLQLGLGAGPAASGVAMMPLMVGLIASSGLCGRLINQTGRFKALLMGGLGVMAVGIALLAFAPAHASLADVGWRVAVIGIGLGPTQSTYSLCMQNVVTPLEIGVATSTAQFARQVGATIGVAAFGTVLTNNLAAAARALGGGRVLTLQSLERLSAPGEGAAHAPAVLDAVSAAVIAGAMQRVFLAGLLVLLLGIAVSGLIPAARLRGRGPEAAPAGAEAPGEGEALAAS